MKTGIVPISVHPKQSYSNQGVRLIKTTISNPASFLDLDDLFENAPCGYIVLDSEGAMAKVNATLLEWLGYERSELVGRHMTDLMKVASRVFYETHFMPMLKMQGFCNEVAFDFKCKDGSVIAVISSATEARQDGNFQFTRVAFFKAIERRQLERNLMHERDVAAAGQADLAARNSALRSTVKKAVGQKREAIREKMEEQEKGDLREQFVAVLGHDLRNPLAAITAGTRVLARENLGPRATQVLQLMEGSVRRMSGLIDDVLDFARGRLGGGIGLERTTGELLEPAIQQVLDEVRARAPESKIVTEIDLTAPVNCDVGRVGQLLSNLVSNALTHGASDQPIIVRAHSRPSGEFELSVSNGGEAIPPDVKDRLFEPFVRGHAKGHQRGLGLGLHIASEIAKAHEGTLTVESTEVETRFTFRIPASDQMDTDP